MKNSFETWIKEKNRSNGARYSKETISGYISSLKTHASKLSDISLADGKYSGWTAQIIQHELDHVAGIVI